MSANIGLTPAPTGSMALPAASSVPSGQSSVPSGQTSGTPQHPSAPTGGAHAISNANTTAGSHSNPPSTGDITISKRFMSDPAWPADLCLDLAKSNWEEWSFQLKMQCNHLGFTKWLKGTLPQPDAALHPKAHDIWEMNDCSLRGFICVHISKADYNAVSHLSTSHLIFKELQQCHEKLWVHAQLLLLKKALDFRYSRDAPFCDGADEILAMHTRIANMGPVDLDQIKIILLLNAFGNNHEHLQSSLYAAMDSPSFRANTIIRCLQHEDTINRARAAQSGTNPTALAAVRRDKPPRLCSNCKKDGHLATYCILLGRGMAGKTIEEARTAQRNARKNGRNGNGNGNSQQTTSATANVATASSTSQETTVTIKGQTFILMPAATAVPASVNTVIALSDTVFPGNLSDYDTDASSFTPSVNIAIAPPLPSPAGDTADASQLASMSPHEQFTYKAYVAMNGASHASVDWAANSTIVDTSVATACPIAYTATRPPISRVGPIPFILDSSANCHISPKCGDFKTLNPIPPLTVKGFGGSSIQAVGMGTIEACVASGLRLSLTNVLFVPNAMIQLLSVASLNHSSNYITHFDSTSCWVTNCSGATIIRGTLSSKRHLYCVSLPSASVAHMPQRPSALYASRVPNIETWHHRLRHCNVRAIVDMARKEAVEGMTIDLSTAPPKCTHCVLGKQTRSPMPKIWEGPKVSRQLERVFVDLCGPMPCASWSGRLYAMHVINNFSGYIWSLPLRTKGDAASVFQLWHKHVTTQTDLPLKSLVTDNGELVSKSMREWCDSLGINHVVTTPYTSAQNGRAEHIHRTILGKAWAMRLACNTPPSFWDEFCATATYLTNFMPMLTLNHKTAYEAWFGRRPSLSHLPEIGCRAFALIQMNNPKVYQRSSPCILIGYAPNLKAYRLWDDSAGKVFNSFHVTFIEHLDTLPSSLLPGTTVELLPDSPPSWDSPAFDALPANGRSVPVAPSHPPLFPNPAPVSASIPSPSSSIPSPSSFLLSPTNTVIQNINVPDNTVSPLDQNTLLSTVPPEAPNMILPTLPGDRLPGCPEADMAAPSDSSTLASPPTDTPDAPPPTIPDPPLRRSTHLHFPYSHTATLDGLLPNPQVAAALSEPLRASPPGAPLSVDDDGDGNVLAFLAEFVPYCDTHFLLPLDVPTSDFVSIPEVLSAAANGSLEPDVDADDDPLWSKALASPQGGPGPRSRDRGLDS